MTSKSKVEITIKGGDIAFKRKIDESAAGIIISFCLQLGNGDSRIDLPHATELEITHRSKRESVAEYVNRSAPIRNPDKILALAGYLRQIQSKESFSPNEIKSLFRDAGEILPANFTRDFRWAQNAGWIAPDQHKKGTFFVTNTGTKVLKDGFPEDALKKSRLKRRKAKKKRKS